MDVVSPGSLGSKDTILAPISQQARREIGAKITNKVQSVVGLNEENFWSSSVSSESSSAVLEAYIHKVIRQRDSTTEVNV